MQPTTTASTDASAINFDSVASLRKTIDNMQLAENVRATNRALIDTLANGEQPFTPDEVEKFQIKYNINWGQLKKLVSDANRQVNGALLFKPQLFTATSKGGEVERRDDYGTKFTTQINRRLLRGELGKTFTYLMLSRNASVCLHGEGVLYFPNDYCVLPKFAPLENLLIPTDTDMDFANLSYFDIRVELSICELNEMISGDTVDEHWNIDEINKIISGLKDFNGLNTNNYNWREHPEKWQEIFKQNKAFLNSDAVAKVKLDYFFSKEGVDNKWFLKVFMREPVGEADPDKFLYENDQPFADDIGKILQAQFGDTSVVAPLKFHSVRGLGQSLYSAANALNRFTSGLFQHGEEQLRTYFRVSPPADKSRQNVIELFQYGIIEDGVTIVPESERHQIDAALIESIQSQCRQNLSENSASFVQDINDGTKKEMTLGEAQIRQQSVNVAISSMLKLMYRLENYLYEEIVRRFLVPTGSEQKAFRDACVADGIPEELLKPENWLIDVEQVLGAGDQSLALQEVGALFNNRQTFDPRSQRIIDRMFVSTVTRDPAKGMLLVPDVKDDSTDGAKAAASLFGSLMAGGQVPFIQGVEQVDYVMEMLKSLAAVIEQVKATDNTGTVPQVLGMANVSADIQKHIDILSGDPTQAQNVKQLSDANGKLMNEIKAFSQRLAEKNKAGQPNKVSESLSYKDAPEDVRRQIEAQAGLQPSTMPVTDPKILKANQSLAINEAKFSQKTRQSQISFEIDQAMKLSGHQTDMSIEAQKSRQELLHAHLEKLNELMLAAQQPSENGVDNSN